MIKSLNSNLFFLILLLFTFYGCEKIANETDPSKIILGKWEIIQIGNGNNLETVENPFGYIKYCPDSVKIEYASDTKEYCYIKYWIDSLLHECIYLDEEHRYVLHFCYKYEFFDKNKKMRLDFACGIAEYSTCILQRIK